MSSLVSDPPTSASSGSAAATPADTAATAIPTVPAAELPAAAQRVTVIKQKSAWSVFDLREVWQYRDLLFSLAERDIKLRYRQTALGPIWVVLQPLLAAGIVTILFGHFAGLKSEKVPYFVFSFAGMMGWNVFMQTLSKASSSLIGNQTLVAKVYFPRLALPFSTALSTLFDLGVSAVVLAVLMAATHIAPGITLLLAPVWFLLLFVLAMGVGLFTGALMVSYRDVGQIQGILLQYGMYATPAGYSLAQAIQKAPKLAWFFQINPLSHLLDGLRWSVFGPGNGVAAPSAWGVLYAVVVTALVFFGGMLAFGHMERKFADVI